ncbi:dephospho-CoA kinase [Flavobacterium akiainvivens]|uniref:Dephospho-CoA kinase n=1 Tax=Flavobacterium akiainvivens TaxID=1202724 RepID=A0A0M9VK47_9FLAO|nr:dephospho-CoA kinase [Flavobacterium akiainvivens]
MPKIIGLTGGIGSGKSTIAGFFAQMGVPVYIADDEAKKILYLPDTVMRLKDVFGDAVFTDGIPDRAKIAALVFNDKQKLEQLNGIIHPAVAKHFTDWVQGQSAPFVIKETAILFESGSYRTCDAIITVTAPEEVRVGRVVQRDGVPREKVLERMANQWSDEKKITLSNYIINNDTLENAREQAVKIFDFLNKIEN